MHYPAKVLWPVKCTKWIDALIFNLLLRLLLYFNTLLWKGIDTKTGKRELFHISKRTDAPVLDVEIPLFGCFVIRCTINLRNWPPVSSTSSSSNAVSNCRRNMILGVSENLGLTDLIHNSVLILFSANTICHKQNRSKNNKIN